MNAFEITQDMKIGWNLGNSLDATGGYGYTGLETETSWGNPKTTKVMIDTVKAKGFNTVRIPTTWYPHLDDNNNIDSEWMARVHEIVDYAVSNDMYVSIDLVEEIIERQLKKYKNKLADQKQAASVFKKEFIEKEFEDEEEIKIIRSKKFDIKPMYPEDACVQMELLGHSFYMFCNAETEQLNVVYKRKGGTYGLIEPDL